MRPVWLLFTWTPQDLSCDHAEDSQVIGWTRPADWKGSLRDLPRAGRQPAGREGLPRFVEHAFREFLESVEMPTSGRVTLGRTGLIFTRAWWCRPGSENGSNESSVMRS